MLEVFLEFEITDFSPAPNLLLRKAWYSGYVADVNGEGLSIGGQKNAE